MLHLISKVIAKLFAKLMFVIAKWADQQSISHIKLKIWIFKYKKISKFYDFLNAKKEFSKCLSFLMDTITSKRMVGVKYVFGTYYQGLKRKEVFVTKTYLTKIQKNYTISKNI